MIEDFNEKLNMKICDSFRQLQSLLSLAPRTDICLKMSE